MNPFLSPWSLPMKTERALPWERLGVRGHAFALHALASGAPIGTQLASNSPAPARRSSFLPGVSSCEWDHPVPSARLSSLPVSRSHGPLTLGRRAPASSGTGTGVFACGLVSAARSSEHVTDPSLPVARPPHFPPQLTNLLSPAFKNTSFAFVSKIQTPKRLGQDEWWDFSVTEHCGKLCLTRDTPPAFLAGGQRPPVGRRCWWPSAQHTDTRGPQTRSTSSRRENLPEQRAACGQSKAGDHTSRVGLWWNSESGSQNYTLTGKRGTGRENRNCMTSTPPHPGFFSFPSAQNQHRLCALETRTWVRACMEGATWMAFSSDFHRQL